jgi:hypothetical protein
METRQLAALFASMAAVALGWTRQEETLNDALATRNLIGQAVGIVVERAFSVLVLPNQQHQAARRCRRR